MKLTASTSIATLASYLSLSACSIGDDATGAGGSTSATAGSTSATAGSTSATAGSTSATGGKRHDAGGSGVGASNAGGGASTGGRGGGTSTGVGGSTAVDLGAIDCRSDGDGKTTLSFVNDCANTVTYRGSDIEGGSLAPGAVACVDIGDATQTISSKRYWGWTGTDPGGGRHTLAEFTFNTDFYDLDWYNISHVDAHNLPMAILPWARPKCRQLQCARDFLGSCPLVGQYRDPEGQVISCVSPNRDDPNGTVVQLFEECNDAYAWSGDDQKGTDPSPMVGCEVEDFDIVFCPEAP